MNKKEIFIDFIASVFKVGYVPIASGTVASFIILPVFVLLYYLAGIYFDILWCILSFFILYISFPISTAAEKLYQEKDSHKIVIDEVVGYCFTMLFLPGLETYTFFNLLKIAFFGFVIFRFFDIVKVYPIRPLQKMEGGFGVVMDDFVAGVFSNFVLRILIYYNVC